MGISSVEPPPYLAQLNPRLYEQECQRVQARFDEAVELAEQAFVDELAQLVSHLTDRLAGSDDGKPKVFRDSAVEHLTEFFQRFRRLNIGSNTQLDELVGQAQQIVRGVQPQQLRDNQSLRQRVVTQLTGVQATLEGLLVDRPRRSILPADPSGVGLMEVVNTPDGTVTTLYTELLDLSALGVMNIVRASHVEPDDHGQ